jgi:hypothetical protein
MPITITDLHKEIFQAHRFASEYRLAIVTALGGGLRGFSSSIRMGTVQCEAA